jgi:hypothetical protein
LATVDKGAVATFEQVLPAADSSLPVIAPPHAKEIALLKLLASGQRRQVATLVLAREVDVARLFDFLQRHHLCQYVSGRLDALQLRNLFPHSFRERLAWENAAQDKQRAALTLALRTLHDSFAAGGVDFVLTKGLHLAAQYWGGVENRFTWDLDILVRAGDVDRAIECLQRSGFACVHLRPSAARLARRYSHAMEFAGDGVAVDLHWKFRPRPGHRVDYTAVWERSCSWQFDGLQFRVLSAQDTLLMLLLGIAEDIERAQPDYRKLWDIFLILGCDVVQDWETFFHLARQQGVDRIAAATLSFVCHALNCLPEFPALMRALQPYAGPAHCSARELQQLLERPSLHPANRLWVARLQPVPAAYYLVWWTLTAPMRYLVWH